MPNYTLTPVQGNPFQTYTLVPISDNPYGSKYIQNQDKQPFDDNKDINAAHYKMLQDRANTTIQTINPGQSWSLDKNVYRPEDFVLPYQEDI